MKLSKQQTHQHAPELLSLLEQLNFERPVQFNSAATHILMQDTVDLFISDDNNFFDTVLNEYDKEKIGLAIVELLEKSNFQSPTIFSPSSAFFENELPEIDNSEKQFHIKLFTEILLFFKKHFNKKVK
jgi:hypothetical protein